MKNNTEDPSFQATGEDYIRSEDKLENTKELFF